MQQPYNLLSRIQLLQKDRALRTGEDFAHRARVSFSAHSTKTERSRMVRAFFLGIAILVMTSIASAAPITNPDDPRSWQGATVGTFAQLYFGANNSTTRQQVVDAGLLDDGIFTASGVSGTLINSANTSSCGFSTDSTGTGDYNYVQPCAFGVAAAANAVDNQWIQTSGNVGDTVWDLGFQATNAALFNTIDHGPLPFEAIESTGYLSNDLTTWTPAVVRRVWLEGFMPNTGILWDGFAFAVGTGTSDTFRYISIVHGGPGALQSDGDDEINGVMGLNANFEPNPTAVPEPASLLLVGSGLALARRYRRRK
jgi:hypothetical protein